VGSILNVASRFHSLNSLLLSRYVCLFPPFPTLIGHSTREYMSILKLLITLQCKVKDEYYPGLGLQSQLGHIDHPVCNVMYRDEVPLTVLCTSQQMTTSTIPPCSQSGICHPPKRDTVKLRVFAWWRIPHVSYHSLPSMQHATYPKGVRQRQRGRATSQSQNQRFVDRF